MYVLNNYELDGDRVAEFEKKAKYWKVLKPFLENQKLLTTMPLIKL